MRTQTIFWRWAGCLPIFLRLINCVVAAEFFYALRYFPFFLEESYAYKSTVCKSKFFLLGKSFGSVCLSSIVNGLPGGGVLCVRESDTVEGDCDAAVEGPAVHRKLEVRQRQRVRRNGPSPGFGLDCIPDSSCVVDFYLRHICLKQLFMSGARYHHLDSDPAIAIVSTSLLRVEKFETLILTAISALRPPKIWRKLDNIDPKPDLPKKWSTRRPMARQSQSTGV